jgi:hypothetical protein
MTIPPVPALARRVSPLDAVSEAIDRTRRNLFPFRFDRWLALGFVAFLDQCGRGQGGANFRVPTSGGGGDGRVGGIGSPDFRVATEWVGNHVILVVVIAGVLLTLIVALTALVLWISSRGTFMYLDNVATGRADVVRPWGEHAERAQSLFAWRFVIGIAALMAVALLLALAGLLVFAYSKGRLAGLVALATGLLVLLPIFLVVLVVSGLVSMALRDFVAPLQWKLRVSCGDAARVVWPLVNANRGSFAVYVGLKFALVITGAVVALAAGCLTCCCGFLPVVSQTLLQPLFYFERTWSLVFLRQLGHDVFAIPTPEPVAE